jgi:hypothetical protein
MLIFRRSNCIVTASGIVTLRKQLLSPLSTAAMNICLRRVTIPDAVTLQFDLLNMNMVLLEICRGLQYNIYYYRINNLCIKLVIETSLHYDARSENHQARDKSKMQKHKSCC